MSEKVDSENVLNENFSFVKSELEILKFWEKNQIFKKSLEQTKNSKEYIFYDGPPFATGLPHHGHLVSATLKDAVPRYFTMKGRYVSRRFGWDCHGLPIEHEIDKKLGMSAQEAVKKLGVKAYNDECRSIVQRYTSEWEKTITRIGRWVDFKNDYKTMDTPFMESVWWVFKQLWDKNLIYQGTKVVPFSTALGTVLSNFEAGSNYQDVQDPAITILFQTQEDKNTYYAAWTTTPWTLPSNLALCVGPDVDYVKLLDEEKNCYLIMAAERAEVYGKKRKYKIIEQFKGTQLKGKKYVPLFNYFSHLESNGAFQILVDNYVTTGDGTGIVHTAPSFGEDDNRVVKEAHLNMSACPVDDAGKFTSEVSDFAGIYVKDADKQIIKNLKDRNLLYEQSVLVHSYPFCPRSDTPLIYKAIPSWYVKVEGLRDRLLKSNEQINWVPSHIKNGRFGKWLEGARDWAISRNRVWGTPIPVWINDKTKKCICFGSIDELYKATNIKLDDLHREHVDPITFALPNEEGIYHRVEDVLDCWFESGSMPYAQQHYPFENKKTFEDGFPAEYIAEGLDQTRGWFYTLTVLSTALFDSPAFKNVIVNGMVMAEDGKKMSKRLKNYTAPDVLMQEYGADALRLYLINSNLVRAEEQRFADSGVKEMVRKALLPWYNSFKFFATYAQVDNYNVSKNFKLGDNIMDRWILSNLQTLKANISKEMEGYRLYNVVPALFTFIEDLTNWYIRLNRSRFWGDGLDDDKMAAYSTLFTTIKELSIAMAPFAPFLSEHIFQELKKFDKDLGLSVHLAKYPEPDSLMINSKLEDAVGRMQQIILMGRQKRNQIQVKVKTPLKTLSIIHKDETILKEIQKLESYIKNELNVKEVCYFSDENKFIKLYAKPNSPVLGKRLGKNFGKFTKLIQNLSPNQLEELEKNGKLSIEEEVFACDDILIFREALPGTQAISNRFISIDMDITLSKELELEGVAREIVNRIQRNRKEQNFNVSDRVQIEFLGDKDIEDAISTHTNYIAKETLAISIKKNDQITDGITYDIDGQKLVLTIKKA